MSPRGRRCDATKFNLVNLIKEHLAMKTILAIDLGKHKSVFCRLNTSSLKPEYFTTKTDPQKFHDSFIELDIESSIVLFEVGSQASCAPNGGITARNGVKVENSYSRSPHFGANIEVLSVNITSI